ncbi:MAG: MoaD/ThiS family protein [Blastocatellia bacterium]
MNIRALFFGLTADLIGQRELTLEPVADSSCEQVVREIVEAFPDISKHKLLYSINQTYACGDEILRDGDELAIFTAVSGG